MKKIDKFTSYGDLKSSKKTTIAYEARLKRHIDFEKVIKEIRAINNYKSNNVKLNK